jgi:hypothetical protein
VTRFVILPRLVPVDDGVVFIYGDRALIFGQVKLSQSIVRKWRLRIIEHAINPVPTLLSLAIFDREGVSYQSSAQICKDGDRGLMYTAHGTGFYDCVKTELGKIMAEAEVNSLEAYVAPAHTRLMTRALKEIGLVKVIDQGIMNNHIMDWVLITTLEPPDLRLTRTHYGGGQIHN